MGIDELLDAVKKSGGVLVVQNLEINNYNAQNLAIGGGATVNVAQSAMSTDGRGIDIRAPRRSLEREERRSLPRYNAADQWEQLPQPSQWALAPSDEENALKYG